MATKDKQKQSRNDVPRAVETESEKRFIRDRVITGDAAKPQPNGELPPGATHKIVEDNGKDLPQIERERFSIY